MLISDKADFRTGKIIKGEQHHYIIIKESTVQENIATLNICVPNNRALKQARQKLIELQGGTDIFIIICRDFNIPLLVIKVSNNWKISKDIVELNNTIYQRDLIDI